MGRDRGASVLGHVVQIKLEVPADGAPDFADGESPLRFQSADGSFYLTDEELLDVRAAGWRYEVVRRLQEADLPVRFSLPHDGAVTDWPPEDARLAVLARLALRPWQIPGVVRLAADSAAALGALRGVALRDFRRLFGLPGVDLAHELLDMP